MNTGAMTAPLCSGLDKILKVQSVHERETANFMVGTFH